MAAHVHFACIYSELPLFILGPAPSVDGWSFPTRPWSRFRRLAAGGQHQRLEEERDRLRHEQQVQDVDIEALALAFSEQQKKTLDTEWALEELTNKLAQYNAKQHNLQRDVEDAKNRSEKLKEQQVDVRFYGFSNTTQPLEKEGELLLPTSPGGAETDIGSAVFNLSQEVRNERQA